MQHRFHPGYIQLSLNRTLATVLQYIIEQLGLPLLDQFGNRNGGIHVRQCIVCTAMVDAIGTGQIFQPHARATILVQRPLDTFRPQRACQP